LLRNAGPDSLVLIDEFGSGTEPTAGGAIAETILAEIERRGVFGIITTHYTNLKLYAERSTGSINGAMLFDTAKIQPLYKLEMGLPGNSFAFELARKIGLPEQIVKQAEERAGTEYVDFERQLRKISKNRRVLEEKLNRIKYTDKTLESITERYQKELSQIQETKKQIILEAKQEAASIIVEANKKIEATIKGIKEAQAEKERTKIIRRELGEFQKRVEQEQQDEKDKIIAAKMEQLIERKKRKEERKKRETPKVSDNLDIEGPKRDSSPPKPLEAGDKIRIKSNGLTGEITRINNKRITISVGNIISTIREEEIERISNREYNQSIKSSSKYIGETAEGIQERRLNFKQSIDIRGERLSEAIDIVSRYIDDALMVGAAEVKILHGKGNGILKEEIRKYLKTIGGVVSCEDEDIRYGGSGITIVRLNG
jgi:DNA mismatch repair protein MutS2